MLLKIIPFIKNFLNSFLKMVNFKKNGISGHLRVKNEATTLKYCVESVINFVDELIITYNDCTDQSESIILELKNKYPDKIKVFEWTKKPFRMWEYSNFGMKKCKYKWYFRIDGDQIYFLDQNKKAIILNSKKKNIFEISGIAPFNNGGKYSLIVDKKNNTNNIEWFDENNKKWILSNISEETYIFVKGLEKYKRNDKYSFCEYIDFKSKKKHIFLGNVYVHFIYMKRKVANDLKKVNFDDLTLLEIKKLNLYEYLNLIYYILDNKYSSIPFKFKERERSDYWYEQKQKEWKNNIY